MYEAPREIALLKAAGVDDCPTFRIRQAKLSWPAPLGHRQPPVGLMFYIRAYFGKSIYILLACVNALQIDFSILYIVYIVLGKAQNAYQTYLQIYRAQRSETMKLPPMCGVSVLLQDCPCGTTSIITDLARLYNRATQKMLTRTAAAKLSHIMDGPVASRARNWPL